MDCDQLTRDPELESCDEEGAEEDRTEVGRDSMEVVQHRLDQFYALFSFFKRNSKNNI